MSNMYLCLKSFRDKKIVTLEDNFIQFNRELSNECMDIRFSPIYPLQILGVTLPNMKQRVFISFFIFEDAFTTIGKIKSYLTQTEQNYIWFSHGLASIVIISNTNIITDKILSSKETKYLAYEKWSVYNGCLDPTIESDIINLDIEEENSIGIIDYSELDDNVVKNTIHEIESCLIQLRCKTKLFLPKMSYYYNSIPKIVNSIIEELKYYNQIYNDETASTFLHPKTIESIKNSPELLNSYISNNSDSLIQIAASLNIVLSQAFSGTIPILDNKSDLQSFSLLGIGNAFKSFFSISRYIENIFENRSIITVIKNKFGDVQTFFDPLKHLFDFNGDNWEPVNENFWKNSLEARNKEESNPKLTYFSKRLGFKESEFAITAASQTLKSCMYPSWNLLTLTHEILHGHVRGILSELFNTTEGKSIHDYINEYEEWHNNCGERKIQLPLDSAFRFAIFNYCQFKINPIEKSNKNELKVGISNHSRIFNSYRIYFKEINEIFVHVLDYTYTYSSIDEVYIRSLWETWKTVPVVNEKINHYILRTLIILGLSIKSISLNEKFEIAKNKFIEHLDKLNNNNSLNHSLLVRSIQNNLNNESICDNLKKEFIIGLYLAVIVKMYLVVPGIHTEMVKDWRLNVNEEGKYSYSLNIGEYSDKPIKSPIALIWSSLENTFDKALNEIDIEHSSAWLFLALSSVVLE